MDEHKLQPISIISFKKDDIEILVEHGFRPVTNSILGPKNKSVPHNKRSDSESSCSFNQLIDHIVKSQEVQKHEERLKKKKIIDELERKYIERDVEKEEMGSDY